MERHEKERGGSCGRVLVCQNTKCSAVFRNYSKKKNKQNFLLHDCESKGNLDTIIT